MSTVHVDPGAPFGAPPRLQPAVRTPEGIGFLRGLAGTRVRQNGCAAAGTLSNNARTAPALAARPSSSIEGRVIA